VENSIEQIQEDGLAALENAADEDAVNEITVKYLGRKGIVTRFLRNIAQLPPEERPAAGKQANLAKKAIEAAASQALERIAALETASLDQLDVSLPGRPLNRGTLHPVTRISNEICGIFARLGFDIAEGPEIETDYYNFEALNIPKNHPARDMQDTFYISDNVVLRTHTSPTQPRVMEKQQPPVRIVAPGKVYRCDSDLTPYPHVPPGGRFAGGPRHFVRRPQGHLDDLCPPDVRPADQLAF